MKKILYLLILISILSSPVFADILSTNSTGTIVTGTSYLQVNLVNQDPYPADPGAYVNLLFKVENRGTNNADNTTIELMPQYPFSLDPGVSSIQNLGTVNGLQTGGNAFQVRYKVKVDDNALNGDNEIKLKYSDTDGSITQTLNVSVTNPRTDFDVVVQDSTTLAIANIGNNTASSVIVRIPQQENFRVNGTSAAIIGNLNAGDYTLTTFQLFSIRSNTSNSTNNLTVEISYTDTLGIRRTFQKNVSYEFSSNGLGNVTGRFTQGSQLSFGNGLWYIVIGVAGIVIVIAFIKLRTRKKK